MRPFLKRFESVFDRLLGLFGGLVCAFAASLAAFYCCGVFHCHIWFLVTACIASVLVFSMLGLILPRYFTCFFMPVFNCLANADGGAHCDDGYSWRASIASIGLFVALAALVVGALFQIHIAFGVGVILFVGYAIFALEVFFNKHGAS